MLIEFTKAWRQWKPGQRTDFFTPGSADILFRKGVAREAGPEPVATVEAVTTDVPPTDPPAAPAQPTDPPPMRVKRRN